MGYDIFVTGKIKFKDIEGFKKEFDTVAQHRSSEIGLYGDFDYFFTKMWGDHLENLEVDKDGFVELNREGKLWYDEKKAIEFIAKYAYGIIVNEGEDDKKWLYVIEKNGTIKQQFVKQIEVD